MEHYILLAVPVLYVLSTALLVNAHLSANLHDDFDIRCMDGASVVGVVLSKDERLTVLCQNLTYSGSIRLYCQQSSAFPVDSTDMPFDEVCEPNEFIAGFAKVKESISMRCCHSLHIAVLPNKCEIVSKRGGADVQYYAPIKRENVVLQSIAAKNENFLARFCVHQQTGHLSSYDIRQSEQGRTRIKRQGFSIGSSSSTIITSSSPSSSSSSTSYSSSSSSSSGSSGGSSPSSPNIEQFSSLAEAMAAVAEASAASALCYEEIYDILIIADGSGSIGPKNFIKQQSFLKSLLSEFTIGPHASHVAYMQFATWPTLHFNFDQNYDIPSVKSAIDAIIQDSSLTYLNRALNAANAGALTAAEGRRAGVKGIVFIITDGASYDDPRPGASAMSALGHDVWAIGVGNYVDVPQLQTVPSKPSQMVLAASFNDLGGVAKKLTAGKCLSN